MIFDRFIENLVKPVFMSQTPTKNGHILTKSVPRISVCPSRWHRGTTPASTVRLVSCIKYMIKPCGIVNNQTKLDRSRPLIWTLTAGHNSNFQIPKIHANDDSDSLSTDMMNMSVNLAAGWSGGANRSLERLRESPRSKASAIWVLTVISQGGGRWLRDTDFTEAPHRLRPFD